MNPTHQVAGASSDLSVINVGETPGGLKVGDSIRFRLNYAALMRAMSSRYIRKVVEPPLDSFPGSAGSGERPLLPPVLGSV
jgi:predicted amino acid racemase